jgi:hypothetical protein
MIVEAISLDFALQNRLCIGHIACRFGFGLAHGANPIPPACFELKLGSSIGGLALARIQSLPGVQLGCQGAQIQLRARV